MSRGMVTRAASLILTGAIGCSGAGDGRLGADDLGNATYLSSYFESGAVQLADGRFERPYPGSASKLVIELTGPIAHGDLNDDGLIDAAAILTTDPGGSGTFIDLAVVLNNGGSPYNASLLALGDRVEVRRLDIEAGRIELAMLTHGPDDALCCPTVEVERSFRILGPRLMGVLSGTLTYRERIAIPSHALVKVVLADVSRQDVSAPAIAEESFTAPGQVPIPFELLYDPASIDANHTYAISARITVDEDLLFTTTNSHEVLTRGAPSSLEIVIQRAVR